MALLKTILVFLLSLVTGFGVWYLIFWFITNESNLFIWNPWVKGVYLFFGVAASGQILENLNK